MKHNTVPEKKSEDYCPCVKIAESYLVEIHFSSYTTVVSNFKLLPMFPFVQQIFLSVMFLTVTPTGLNLLEPNQRRAQRESVNTERYHNKEAVFQE